MARKFGWKSPSGVIIEIQPFMSGGWTFTRLSMTEVVGGKIAEGELSLSSIGVDESIKLVSDVHFIEIYMEYPNGGQIYKKIKGFITSKNWTKNVLDIKFVCIPHHKFFSEARISTTKKNPEKAIEDLWGKENKDLLDIRCKSDLNNDVQLFQFGESNYKICKKIAQSFKKNSIFCFGLEGLMIKDIIGKNSRKKDEPEFLVLGDGEVNQTSGFNLNFNYKIYKEEEDPWAEEDYSEKKQHSTLTALTIDDEYYLVNRSHFGLLSNYVHNKNLMESRFQTSLTILTNDALPNFKIGDTIKYRRSTDKEGSNPFELFFVSKMSYFISTEGDLDENGLHFSVTSILRGIGDKGQELSKDGSKFDSNKL